MKIDIICNDGSPLGVVWDDIYGNNGRLGVGGAELALLTMCEAWAGAGHRVRLYNDPKGRELKHFEQYPVSAFSPSDKRDILIIFRSPNKRIAGAKGKKIWWSTDQFTVGNFQDFSTKVDEIVTISPFHAHYFRANYGIQNTRTIDLPVRMGDYTGQVTKVENRLIYCSVPDRGLAILAKVYPKIVKQVPNVSLVITSDYRLWGAQSAMNENHMTKFIGMPGVEFLGAVPRARMVEEQEKAQIQAYPCTYDELFAIANAECQVAGAYPITPPTGALASTNMGDLLDGTPTSEEWQKRFVHQVVERLSKPEELRQAQQALQIKARERLSLGTILPQWDKVFNG